MRFVLAGLSSPTFANDGKRIFFLSAAWVVSDALHVVDIASGRQHYVAPANSLEIVRGGRYAGCLLLQQHRYWLSYGTYDWLWLFAENGREIGPIANVDADDFDERLSEFKLLFNADSAVAKTHSCATPPKDR